jgi:hypothetical protein
MDLFRLRACAYAQATAIISADAVRRHAFLVIAAAPSHRDGDREWERDRKENPSHRGEGERGRK